MFEIGDKVKCGDTLYIVSGVSTNERRLAVKSIKTGKTVPGWHEWSIFVKVAPKFNRNLPDWF